MLAKLIGKSCPQGTGGRDCACCGQAPGKPRKVTKRAAKRGERQEWRNSLQMERSGHETR